MVKWRFWLFGIFILLGCQQNDPEKQVPSPEENNQENLRMAMIKKASLQPQLGQVPVDTAIKIYLEIAADYEQAEQWDSLSQVGLDLLDLDYAYAPIDYGKIEEALKKVLALMPLQEEVHRAMLFELLGLVNYYNGLPADALEYYKSCAALAEQYAQEKLLGRVYNMLCIINTQLGDFAYAEQCCHKGFLLNLNIENVEEAANNYLNLGKAFTAQGKWEQAIDVLQQAQQLHPDTSGYFENSLAEAKLVGGKFTESEALAKKAIKIANRVGESGFVEQAYSYRILGDLKIKNKAFEKAQDYYQKSLNGLLEHSAWNNREIGKGYILLGDALEGQDLQKLALENYQKAIQRFIPRFAPSSVEELPLGTSFTKEVWLMEALRSKGRIFLDQYRQKGNLDQLKIAARHLKKAVDFIHHIKMNYSEQEAKRFLGDYSIPFIEDAIGAQLLLYAQTNQTSHQDTAFQLAQQATAFLLKESVTTQYAFQMARITEDTVKLWEDLQATINV